MGVPRRSISAETPLRTSRKDFEDVGGGHDCVGHQRRLAIRTQGLPNAIDTGTLVELCPGEPYIDEGDKVERYKFYPDTIRVQKGQNVILHFLGINGGSGHPTTIENYVTASFTFMRNQTVTKEFVADQAGVFAITCSSHQPTMNAYLIVEDPEAGGAMGVSTIGVALLAVQAAVLAITVAVVVIGRRGGRS